MNKQEKIKLVQAIELLMSDDGFNDAIDILCSLAGLERTATKMMNNPEGKIVSIFEIFKKEK